MQGSWSPAPDANDTITAVATGAGNVVGGRGATATTAATGEGTIAARAGLSAKRLRRAATAASIAMGRAVAATGVCSSAVTT